MTKDNPMEGSSEKDEWDKFEILAKGLGALLIPAIVAFSVYLWNSQRTEEVKNTNFIDLAVKILSKTPDIDNPEDLALRTWAAQVLASPENPPSFGEAEQEAIVLSSFALGSAFTTDVLKRPPPLSQETVSAILKNDRQLGEWVLYVDRLCDEFGCNGTWGQPEK